MSYFVSKCVVFEDKFSLKDDDDEISLQAPRNDSIRKHMLAILGSQKGFRHFQNYLCKEFAQENILFFVEILKFKKIMKESLEVECDDMTLLVRDSRRFCPYMRSQWIL